MTFEQYVKDPTTLNIFCDASINPNGGNVIGCPGAIVVTNLKDIVFDRYQILYNTTNNRSELTALFIALQLALEFRENYSNINIFSDSKITVYGITSWIYPWLINIRDYQMYSNSRTLIMNQDIIADIIRFITNNNLMVNIYHQKGHVATTNDSLDNAINVFFRSNNIICSRELILSLSEFNNIIDCLTKDILTKGDPTPDYSKLFYRYLNPTHGNLLKKLINLKEFEK